MSAIVRKFHVLTFFRSGSLKAKMSPAAASSGGGGTSSSTPSSATKTSQDLVIPLEPEEISREWLFSVINQVL